MKKNNVLRIGLLSAGVSLALFVAVSGTPSKAHAALVLDPTTKSMLVETISATGGLMGTVQAHINAGDFSAGQSAALSSNLGGISNVLALISSMIGGIGFPNTGFAPRVGAIK